VEGWRAQQKAVDPDALDAHLEAFTTSLALAQSRESECLLRASNRPEQLAAFDGALEEALSHLKNVKKAIGEVEEHLASVADTYPAYVRTWRTATALGRLDRALSKKLEGKGSLERDASGSIALEDGAIAIVLNPELKERFTKEEALLLRRLAAPLWKAIAREEKGHPLLGEIRSMSFAFAGDETVGAVSRQQAEKPIPKTESKQLNVGLIALQVAGGLILLFGLVHLKRKLS
jgi:hypothetical protein